MSTNATATLDLTTTSPMGRELGPPLRMIHTRELPAQGPSGKYVLPTWQGLRFVTQDSKLYRCGGPLASITIKNGSTCDIMLCWKQQCAYCSSPKDGNDEVQRQHALAAEDGITGSPDQSPYKGMPYLHIIGNTKRGDRALQFDAKRPTEWSTPAITLDFQCWLDDAGMPGGALALRRVLMCHADSCRVCTEDEWVDKWERDRAPGGEVWQMRQAKAKREQEERQSEEYEEDVQGEGDLKTPEAEKETTVIGGRTLRTRKVGKHLG